jgi:putative ATP-binding cassette transporter
VARVWALTRPYFFSEDKYKAWALLAAIVLLNLGTVYLSVLLNDWRRVFYDALQEKNEVVFWQQLWRFLYLALSFVIAAIYTFYLTQVLELRWRAWMTHKYLAKWLAQHHFYQMELNRFAPGTVQDNPDQRIQEDIAQFTSLTVGLSMGLLNSVVTLASFVGILWGLSGGFSFHVNGNEYVIYGFMVWIALLYCLIGSVVTHYLGKPQIFLNFQQQRVEADFRHRMVRVREYSESIALERGEVVEGNHLRIKFRRVFANQLALIQAQKKLMWFTVLFGQTASVFPIIVAAPRFFSGAIALGELMQIASAFGEVQGALNWFVDNYQQLASWRATTDRLTSFSRSLQTFATPAAQQDAPAGQAVRSTDLQVSLPNGEVLLQHLNLSVAAGDTVLLSGPSGSGKSTLFRSLAGIWPFAQGSVARAAETMFLPQRPYFPDGPLRDALAYPLASTDYNDEVLQQALRDALLPELCSQLDRSAAWSQQLSGGEQQRLAIARVLLKRPRWVFADEATSALDEAAEATLYQRLRDLVAQQNGALVSIAHRPGVAAYHQQHWRISAQPAGSAALFALSQNPA